MGELGTTAKASVNRTGVYLAVLQLVFTLGWTTYVIYLPKLAAEVGIAPSAVILILMLDQAIFTITDTAMGIAADKIALPAMPRVATRAFTLLRKRDFSLTEIAAVMPRSLKEPVGLLPSTLTAAFCRRNATRYVAT